MNSYPFSKSQRKCAAALQKLEGSSASELSDAGEQGPKLQEQKVQSNELGRETRIQPITRNRVCYNNLQKLTGTVFASIVSYIRDTKAGDVAAAAETKHFLAFLSEYNQIKTH